MPSFPQRITFDSNVWEKVFAPYDCVYGPVRGALAEGKIKGFICESGFRIEGIIKRQRPAYFSQPSMSMDTKIKGLGGERFELMMSIGPDDDKHPGLPEIQMVKLRAALESGVKILWGRKWMGLPRPSELCDLANFVTESAEEARTREERQLSAAFQN